MKRIQYILDIKEAVCEGDTVYDDYSVSVYTNRISFNNEGKEHSFNGRVTNICIYENYCVFKSSLGERFEIKSYNQLSNHVFQLIWMMSVCKDAFKIIFVIDNYHGSYLRIFKSDNYFDVILKPIKNTLQKVNFKLWKRLTFKSDDECYSVLVYQGFIFGIIYNDKYSFRTIVPSSTFNVFSGNAAIIEYTKKDGTENLSYYYYDRNHNIHKTDITEETIYFLNDYCEGVNLGMLFEVIKDHAYGFENTIRAGDIIYNYGWIK